MVEALARGCPAQNSLKSTRGAVRLSGARGRGAGGTPREADGVVGSGGGLVQEVDSGLFLTTRRFSSRS